MSRRFEPLVIRNFKNRYIAAMDMYAFGEDILRLEAKSAEFITDEEALLLQRCSEMIVDLERMFGYQADAVCDFLISCNEDAPFNGMSPMGYVMQNPNNILSAAFYVMCLKTHRENQHKLEHLI